MSNKFLRPKVSEVKIEDSFWTNYLEKIRTVFLTETFDKLEKNNYFEGFYQVRDGITGKHPSHYFADGLVFESIRGASDFLAIKYDAELDARLDKYIELFKKVQDAVGDGFISTYTTTMLPNKRWGENDGDIVLQHDVYNQGALIEAGVSHYLATKKTTLLEIAVKTANHMSDVIGLPPKRNIISGHPLGEEALIKLYCLFRDNRELDEFAKQNNVVAEEYLRVALFQLDNRGNYVDRAMSKVMKPYYNQDHVTFREQTEAVGHSVRACLLYIAGASAINEAGKEEYRKAVTSLWDNIANRKMHINGGVGSRHDIEGFDDDYALPNDAYLETCASISLAFFSGEMALIDQNAKYMQCFERSLYNNILGAVSNDVKTFTYQNPLVMDGTFRRGEWHTCPCCPPMLLKFYSALGTYILSYNNDNVYLNLYIGSKINTQDFTLNQTERKIIFDTKGLNKTLHLIIPEYAQNFELFVNGKAIDYKVENGYAVIDGVFSEKDIIEVKFTVRARRVFANQNVQADKGLVAITLGAKVYCAEGKDNGGEVDFELAKDPELKVVGENIKGKTSDGKEFTLIPYHLWGNRESENQQDKTMRVWFRQQEMIEKDIDTLYDYYE